MTDNAQKIGGQVWQWYKQCRDTKKDNDESWVRLLGKGQAIVDQYRGCEVDYIFARDMYLLFLDRIERIERGELNG